MAMIILVKWFSRNETKEREESEGNGRNAKVKEGKGREGKKKRFLRSHEDIKYYHFLGFLPIFMSPCVLSPYHVTKVQ
jgi:hypothetical protein